MLLSLDINTLKKNFDSILNLRKDIKSIFNTMKTKLDTLQLIYQEIIQTHKEKDFTFGIDSFYFQTSLLKEDYTHLYSIYKKIDNRLYCEYYNLYRMILDYITNEIKLVNIKDKIYKEFKPYKHLNTDITYGIDNIIELHSKIIESIIELENILSERETILSNDKKQSNMGINIENLINIESYFYTILKAKIDMFKQHLDIFNIHHKKYYNKLFMKSKLQVKMISEEIFLNQFTQNYNMNRNENENEYEYEYENKYENENENKKEIKDITIIEEEIKYNYIDISNIIIEDEVDNIEK